MNRIDALRLGAATGICLSVLAIVLYETFDGRTAEIQQEPAPVIEPRLIAAVFALGALVVVIGVVYQSGIVPRNFGGDRS